MQKCMRRGKRPRRMIGFVSGPLVAKKEATANLLQFVSSNHGNLSPVGKQCDSLETHTNFIRNY